MMTRRKWMAALAGGGGLTALLAALGVRPRFRNGFSFAGSRKKVVNRPEDDSTFLASPGIRCLVIGDWGTGHSLQSQIAGGMQAFARQTHPQFVISTGDNFYPRGVTSVDDPMFRTIFEDVYTGADLQIPWYAALGNHDHFGSIQSQISYSEHSSRWRLPSAWYRFSQAHDGVSADFFILDTDALVAGETREQLGWLNHELESSTADWKICVGHHPIRSYGHYGGDPTLVREVKPILDRHGVAAYLCGHDHDLQLVKAPEDHFVCVVSGGGGKARDTRFGEDSRFAWTNGGFAALTLTKTALTAGFLDPDGNLAFVEHCLRIERTVASR